MSAYKNDLLDFFAKIANGLRGQRLGLTIFDGVPASLIPLSDDYDAVINLTDELKKNFSQYGTAVAEGSVSAIGDGVMGCINSFDNLENNERSKSIIIATDNIPGDETVDINQAARYAKRYGITFYGISINGFPDGNDHEKLFQNAVGITGGSFYNINTYSADGSVTENIIRKVLAQEAAKVAGASEVVYTDSPAVMLIIATVSFMVFLTLIWRLRL
jgi:hypothetical protein